MTLMRRRRLFACAGGLVSAGAPLGLLAVRLARTKPPGSCWMGSALAEIEDHLPEYIYVGTSTAVAFGVFGYIMGRHADVLAELSETDSLTGLFNARRLFDSLDAELARAKRSREPLSLLLVDLDGLKAINDRHGHAAGDAAIRALARVIRTQLREADIGARWGGDEFAVLAPATSAAAGLTLAERIRAMIPHTAAQWPLTGSVGVATVDPNDREDHVVDAATLMRAADAALYEAKRGGRNRVVSASPHHLEGEDRSPAVRPS